MIDVLELTRPDDAADPLWRAYARMSAESSMEAVGPSGTPVTPAEMLARSQQAEQKLGTRIMRWLARVEGEAVGFARLRVDSSDDPSGGTVLVHVDSAHRGRGIGQLLAQAVREAIPATTDHLGGEVMTPVPWGEGLAAASGGAVAADHPGVRLALRNGFELAQVVWFQRLDLATPVERWVAAQAAVPQAPSVLTFNAHENQHMLAINDELGFERRGTLGLFQLSRDSGN